MRACECGQVTHQHSVSQLENPYTFLWLLFCLYLKLSVFLSRNSLKQNPFAFKCTQVTSSSDASTAKFQLSKVFIGECGCFCKRAFRFEKDSIQNLIGIFNRFWVTRERARQVKEDSFRFVESLFFFSRLFLRPPKTREEKTEYKTHTGKKRPKMFMDCFDLAVVAQRIRFTRPSAYRFLVSWSVFNHQKKRCKRIVRGCWTILCFCVCFSLGWFRTDSISLCLNTTISKQQTLNTQLSFVCAAAKSENRNNIFRG